MISIVLAIALYAILAAVMLFFTVLPIWEIIDSYRHPTEMDWGGNSSDFAWIGIVPSILAAIMFCLVIAGACQFLHDRGLI